LWRWLYGSGNHCHHYATYIVRTDDRLLEEQLFEEGNILHGKKQDQEMVRQFFSYMRVNWINGNIWPTKNGPFSINMSGLIMTPKAGIIGQMKGRN
jgi:hypothetical protein